MLRVSQGLQRALEGDASLTLSAAMVAAAPAMAKGKLGLFLSFYGPNGTFHCNTTLPCRRAAEPGCLSLNRSVDEASVLSCSFANNSHADSCQKGASGSYNYNEQFHFSNDENAFNAPQSCSGDLGLNESNVV